MLRVPLLLLTDIRGFGDGKIASRPLTDIRRQRAPRAVKKIRHGLKARQLHLVAVRLLVLLRHARSLRRQLRCLRLQQPADHILQKAVLSGQLCSAPGVNLTDFVDSVSLRRVLPGEPDADLVRAEPAEKLHKPLVDLPDIRPHAAETELRPFPRRSKKAVRMVCQFLVRVVQD